MKTERDILFISGDAEKTKQYAKEGARVLDEETLEWFRQKGFFTPSNGSAERVDALEIAARALGGYGADTIIFDVPAENRDLVGRALKNPRRFSHMKRKPVLAIAAQHTNMLLARDRQFLQWAIQTDFMGGHAGRIQEAQAILDRTGNPEPYSKQDVINEVVYASGIGRSLHVENDFFRDFLIERAEEGCMDSAAVAAEMLYRTGDDELMLQAVGLARNVLLDAEQRGVQAPSTTYLIMGEHYGGVESPTARALLEQSGDPIALYRLALDLREQAFYERENQSIQEQIASKTQTTADKLIHHLSGHVDLDGVAESSAYAAIRSQANYHQKEFMLEGSNPHPVYPHNVVAGVAAAVYLDSADADLGVSEAERSALADRLVRYNADYMDAIKSHTLEQSVMPATVNSALKLSVGELSSESTHKGMQTTYNQHVDFVDSNDEVVFSFDMRAVNHWGMQQHDYCEDINYTDIYVSLDEKSKEKYPQHKDMLQNIIHSCVDVYDDSHVSDDSDEFTGHIKFHYHLSDYAIEQLAIIFSNLEVRTQQSQSFGMSN